MDEHHPIEAQLRNDPDDLDAWLVYADWLAERGDPRGEVLHLQRRLAHGDDDPGDALRDRYAALCRQVRWPDGLTPPMCYRARFEAMIAELQAHPQIAVRQALVGGPTPPQVLELWRTEAGAAWPDGMTELYREVDSVDIEYEVLGEDGSTGGIHLPGLRWMWDYDALQDELWFDFLEADHPFHRIRPIDRFVPEAYAVLYPVPGDRPAQVAYHYCGEELTPTGLSYRAWLELLFRSRGVAYWLTLTLQPPGSDRRTWVESGIDRMVELFPDLDPDGMRPEVVPTKIY